MLVGAAIGSRALSRLRSSTIRIVFVVLLMWLFVAGAGVLLGGEINEIVERHRGVSREPRERREEHARSQA